MNKVPEIDWMDYDSALNERNAARMLLHRALDQIDMMHIQMNAYKTLVQSLNKQIVFHERLLREIAVNQDYAALDTIAKSTYETAGDNS